VGYEGEEDRGLCLVGSPGGDVAGGVGMFDVPRAGSAFGGDDGDEFHDWISLSRSSKFSEAYLMTW
jgi:hypothetical protein